MLTALHVYPVKSCRGIDVSQARLAATGLEHDREWMVVRPTGRFVTQREEPRLALVGTWLTDEGLQVECPGAGEVFIPYHAKGESMTATVWNDRCGAFDMGAAAADLLTAFLGSPHRLVRFNPATRRASSRDWTGDAEALNQFSDGFPLLGISEASLDQLNRKLAVPLPMNRFRPNLVFSGFEPHGEDDVHELAGEAVTLRAVKPCARCKVTTVDQETGASAGTEPLDTLRTYRMSQRPPGLVFGQNLIPVRGVGEMLAIGQVFTPAWR
jgi:uncharacterized protein YcbX